MSKTKTTVTISMFIIFWIYVFYFASKIQATEVDTTTIEILEIEKTYDFGWPVKDTVESIIHIYCPAYRTWYVNSIGRAYHSNKKPVVLFRYKRIW